MANTTTLQTLSRLLPRLSSDPPSELVVLTSSLLAQSRSKISNLKAEEEVARVFVCAHLACERLKTSLNLPPIEPRPPIPPKLYKKLYAYFDRTLVSQTRKRPRRQSSPSPVRALPQRQTPTKNVALASYRPAKVGLKHSGIGKDSKLPPWVNPTIRMLCKEMNTPRAAPHVFAGVESVWFLPPPAGAGEMSGAMGALIGAVYVVVVEKLGVDADKDGVLDVLQGLVDGGEEEEDVTAEDMEGWEKEVRSYWLAGDWWENLQDEGLFGGEEEDEEDEGEEDEEEEEVSQEVWLERRRADVSRNPGLGRMMDRRFLPNTERRKDWETWRDGILEEINMRRIV